jgi:hypothetical protein
MPARRGHGRSIQIPILALAIGADKHPARIDPRQRAPRERPKSEPPLPGVSNGFNGKTDSGVRGFGQKIIHFNKVSNRVRRGEHRNIFGVIA